MKKITLSIILSALFSVNAFACDETLVAFPRDCAIQDRFVAVRDRYAKQRINLDDVAEYRVMRFIDRQSWEYAKNRKVPVSEIYKPAPDTWRVWDLGIRQVTGSGDLKGSLLTSKSIDENSMSWINRVLLTDGNISTKDSISDQHLAPGDYRKNQDAGVGFCTWRSGVDHMAKFEVAQASALRFQAKWEAALGNTFTHVVESRLGKNRTGKPVAFTSEFQIANTGCNPEKPESVFINYLPSYEVVDRIQWFKVFVQINLDRHASGKPVVAPIEFAAFAQKWLVSLHPFADGNGRTSRAVEDLILAHFGLPYAPAGDLQDDIDVDFESYLELTYQKIEEMLTSLEKCAGRVENRSMSRNAVQCQPVSVYDQDYAIRSR